MALISVIVPVYKVEKYLYRCVDSILAQTFTDFELILVDDGSPDNSGLICDKYKENDNRVHVIHKENGGLSSARNVAIDWTFTNSDSQWLTFIDSDDWVEPRYLEALYNANIDFNTDVSVCDFLETNDDSEPSEIVDFVAKKMNAEDFALEYYRLSNIACAKMYKKECFRDIRYPIGKLHEDAFTTHKILFKDLYISVVDAPMYYYYQGTESIMRSSWIPKRLDEFEALRGRIEYFKTNGLSELYRVESYNLIYRAYKQLEMVQMTESELYREKYEPIVRDILRDSIKSYKKHWNNFSIKGNEWIYELAYPKKMKIYWILNSLKNKFIKKCG